MVAMCYGQTVELVSSDYYAQELKFQYKINAVNNEKRLAESINHTVSGKTIKLTIDSVLLSKDFDGTVTFFRPSDSTKDVKIKMNFVNHEQVINSNKLIHGSYKLQLAWVSNHTNYYKEEIIFIN